MLSKSAVETAVTGVGVDIPGRTATRVPVTVTSCSCPSCVDESAWVAAAACWACAVGTCNSKGNAVNATEANADSPKNGRGLASAARTAGASMKQHFPAGSPRGDALAWCNS